MQENFETMVAELEQVEAQICTIQDNVKILRLQINEGLDEAMKGLEELKAKLPKEQGELNDYMTGKKIKPNDKTDLDHIVSAKTIHDDPARVLAEVDGAELLYVEPNLAKILQGKRGSKSFLERIFNFSKSNYQIKKEAICHYH